MERVTAQLMFVYLLKGTENSGQTKKSNNLCGLYHTSLLISQGADVKHISYMFFSATMTAISTFTHFHGCIQVET